MSGGIDDLKTDVKREVDKAFESVEADLKEVLDDLRDATTDTNDLSKRLDRVETAVCALMDDTSGSNWVSQKVTELGRIIEAKSDEIEALERALHEAEAQVMHLTDKLGESNV